MTESGPRVTVDPHVSRALAGQPICPSCSSPVSAGERFCEACGAPLDLSSPPPEPADLSARASVAALSDDGSVDATCHECGGDIAPDGYCLLCGARAVTLRDHFSEQPVAWVAAVCDRGIRHHRNEDAVALAARAEPGSHAVLVVCDGVSTSTDSDVASLAAARAARDELTVSDPVALGTVVSRVAATAKAMTHAVTAANEAVIANTIAAQPNPASCTFAAAVIDRSLLVAGWVGDSRVYWLPDSGDPRLVSTDDSFAAEQIAAGVPREEAESGPRAHAITRWLGVDAPDPTPRTASLELSGPGWVLACSDGLWNYCSDAADLSMLVRETARESGDGPLDLAAALVDWANAQGGMDNITVALARSGQSSQNTS